MIEEFKDELRVLKNIFSEIKRLEPLREQEINEIKNETTRKLNMPDDEINNILEKLDVNLTTLKIRCIICGKPNDFEKERELRLLAKEEINKIEGLKEEVELLDYLLAGETKASKLLTDLEFGKIETLYNITVLESKLINLEISPERTNRIKIRFNNLSLCYCKSKSNIHNSQMVFIPHPLL